VGSRPLVRPSALHRGRVGQALHRGRVGQALHRGRVGQALHRGRVGQALHRGRVGTVGFGMVGDVGTGAVDAKEASGTAAPHRLSGPPVGRSVRHLALGDRRYDVEHRALVMGILNRTPDSFFDRGATFGLDALLERAERLVAEGADVLDVGGVKAGPGPEVGEQEELDRVVPAVEAIVARFDVPVSVDTWRANVARASFQAGAVVGNDISGFADPDYLRVAASAGASVVATHIRLGPRVPDPEPVYSDVVATVAGYLAERAAQATTAGVPSERVVLDAGLDLGKTADQSLALLRASDVLAGLGHPLLLSASNKTFLGVKLGLELAERREASLAAAALGIARGCRIVRVHDVVGAVRARDALEPILSARHDGPVLPRGCR
jgi:dihydropteroate synthase